jgi:alanine racemase
MNRTKRKRTCKTIPAADKDIQAVIDIAAIKHNLQFLKGKTKTDIMPVLKADAYGHGLVEFRKLHVKYIGVATLGEAILLRKSGDRGRILSWMYNVDMESSLIQKLELQ